MIFCHTFVLSYNKINKINDKMKEKLEETRDNIIQTRVSDSEKEYFFEVLYKEWKEMQPMGAPQKKSDFQRAQMFRHPAQNVVSPQAA